MFSRSLFVQILYVNKICEKSKHNKLFARKRFNDLLKINYLYIVLRARCVWLHVCFLGRWLMEWIFSKTMVAAAVVVVVVVFVAVVVVADDDDNKNNNRNTAMTNDNKSKKDGKNGRGNDKQTKSPEARENKEQNCRIKIRSIFKSILRYKFKWNPKPIKIKMRFTHTQIHAPASITIKTIYMYERRRRRRFGYFWNTSFSFVHAATNHT